MGFSTLKDVRLCNSRKRWNLNILCFTVINHIFDLLLCIFIACSESIALHVPYCDEHVSSLDVRSCLAASDSSDLELSNFRIVSSAAMNTRCLLPAEDLRFSILFKKNDPTQVVRSVLRPLLLETQEIPINQFILPLVLPLARTDVPPIAEYGHHIASWNTTLSEDQRTILLVSDQTAYRSLMDLNHALYRELNLAFPGTAEEDIGITVMIVQPLPLVEMAELVNTLADRLRDRSHDVETLHSHVSDLERRIRDMETVLDMCVCATVATLEKSSSPIHVGGSQNCLGLPHDEAFAVARKKVHSSHVCSFQALDAFRLSSPQCANFYDSQRGYEAVDSC